jgi:dTDP-4-amino-4,6-dideoxygalactose transaminase
LHKILAIGKKHNIPVIEDACQAAHAEWKGKKVGGFGRIGCFSFQETKVLPGGEAGALMSDDQELIEKAYMFRNFGSDPKSGHYAIRGYKYRISDFAAAVLMGQLERYEELCAKRESHAAYLIEELAKPLLLRRAMRLGAFQRLAPAESCERDSRGGHSGGVGLPAAQ